MEQIFKRIKEEIFEQTGIAVPVGLIEIDLKEEIATLLIGGKEIGNIDISEDEFEVYEEYLEELEVLFEEIVEDEIETIRNLLIDHKIIVLENNLKNQIEVLTGWVLQELKANNLEEHISIDIENFGYHGQHWEMEEEYIQGMPSIGIKITNFDNIDIDFPIDTGDENVTLDLEKIKETFRDFLKSL